MDASKSPVGAAQCGRPCSGQPDQAFHSSRRGGPMWPPVPSSESGFTLIEIAAAMLILAVALGQLFLLFPMGLKLQQRAEDQTYVADLGKHMVSEIRGGARVSTNYWEGFSVNDTVNNRYGFMSLYPEKYEDAELEQWTDPAYSSDEVFNGRDDDGDGDVDEKACGRGYDDQGDEDPWRPDFMNFEQDKGWIGSPSPIQIAKVLDTYNGSHYNGSHATNYLTFGELYGALSFDQGAKNTLREQIMKYRWTARVLDDEPEPTTPDLTVFYDPDKIGPAGQNALKAQNPRLCYEIFKAKNFLEDEDHDDPKSTLKKLSVKVYWQDGEQINRSEEFVTYVANY